jgi:hypothetical protein
VGGQISRLLKSEGFTYGLAYIAGCLTHRFYGVANLFARILDRELGDLLCCGPIWLSVPNLLKGLLDRIQFLGSPDCPKMEAT